MSRNHKKSLNNRRSSVGETPIVVVKGVNRRGFVDPFGGVEKFHKGNRALRRLEEKKEEGLFG